MAEPTAPRRTEIVIRPVTGLPDFRPGDDLAAAVLAAAPWLVDGDVVVVTSKAVSKVEGRLVEVPTDPEARDAARRAAVLAEADRVVARHRGTTITRTRHGFVLAASGVDGSNVDAAEIALLPLNPDASAAALRTRLAYLGGVRVGVVVSDTMGRAWRAGQTDVALGAAGVAPLRDYRGGVDTHGNPLVVTEMAEADEIAAAADLVKGKLLAVPVAVVRGLFPVDDGRGAAVLVRPVEQDMFHLGARDVVAARRDAEHFADVVPDPETVQRVLAAAGTAPPPPSGATWRAHPVTDPADRAARWPGLPAGPALFALTLDPAAAGGAALSTADLLAAGAALEAVLVQAAAEGLGAAHRWPTAVDGAPDATADAAAPGTAVALLALGHPLAVASPSTP